MDESATWRSEGLGPASELRLPQGNLRYHERGSGPSVVFLHGLIANANLWRKVVPVVSRGARCITLDLPLGSHVAPMHGDADLTPPGLADLMADALAALDLEDVTLVANDTGGALAQILTTRRPERIGRLVLTSCDSFDNFLPALFQPLTYVARVPGGLLGVMGPLRLRPLRRLPVAYGWLAKRPVEDQAADSYVLPAVSDVGVRRDLAKALRGVDSRHTLDAATRLSQFEQPTLIAWSSEDRFFPVEHAERLATILPDARLEWIEDSYTFSPEDRPDRLAELVSGFVAQPATVG